MNFVISFSQVADNSIGLVGGKGANLARLSQAGLPVPDGFCLTTGAFGCFMAGCPDIEKFYLRLERLDVQQPQTVRQLGEELRAELSELKVPGDVRAELTAAWRRLGGSMPCAVRSSATMEDLASASFAGQYDTFLNVRTEDQLVDSVRRCWVSVFTDRAISYRAQKGLDHRDAKLAAVVQLMVAPEASGVMFTADPVSGHRGTVVINAAYGLGEAVVSGLVNPDLYLVDGEGGLKKSVTEKDMMIVARTEGGVVHQDVPPSRRAAQVLPDAVIRDLAAQGRRIQELFGTPQDIEWALDDGGVRILQARPVTSLFPLPEPPSDHRLHVYFSFGHQQMMTDPIKPLGLSVLRTFFPFGQRLPNGESMQLVQAGNRLFFDYTAPLHNRFARTLLSWAAGAMDRRAGNALVGIAERPDFRLNHRVDPLRDLAIYAFLVRAVARVTADLCWSDMGTRQARAQRFIEQTLASTRNAVGNDPDVNRIARIQQELERVPRRMFYRLTLTQVSAMIARRLVESLCRAWIGDTTELPALDKSLPGNVTTEMMLAIGDLADLVRGNLVLLDYLQSQSRPFSFEDLAPLPGGTEFGVALQAVLQRYGMRGPGEVDITRTRWREQPAALFPAIVSNTRSGGTGEHRERFLAGELEAMAATARILSWLREARMGWPKAAIVARLITVQRTMMGMREHLKFLAVGLFDVYRDVIRAEAARMVASGILDDVSDAEYLTLQELRELVDGTTPADLPALISARKQEHDLSRSLHPPRLFTSEGEIITGTHAAGDATGTTLTGSPVSAGVVEGRARVVLRPQDADLQDGDILVAPFTDPGWTPLFSAVRGMVLEIGGLMTHGAVVARELGLPTVVGVDGATRVIRDGERIRVDGSLGIVELLRDKHQ